MIQIPKFTAYGSEFCFDFFLMFVKENIAPYLEMPFIEENKLREIFDNIINNRYSAQQIHRGWGKTEVMIWINCYIICCCPINPFSGKVMREGLILTSADESLSTLSSRLKQYFYMNPQMKLLIPENKSLMEEKKNDYWNSSELYFNHGTIVHLRTILSKSIRGNHPDWIAADDLVGDNSPIVDKKLEEIWFYAVDGCSTAKNALVFVFGTPRRMSDLMQKMNESEGYFFKKYPILDEGQVISKRWSIDKVEETKKRIGSVTFQCEYMLNPIDNETSLIKGDWIKSCYSNSLSVINSEEQIKRFEEGSDTEYTFVKDDKKYLILRPKWAVSVYMGVDFAFSDRITADKSVFTIIAEYKKDDKFYYIILDQITKKGWSASKQFEFMEKLNEFYKFDMIGVEENSLKAVTDKISSLNLPIKRFWTGNTNEKENIHTKFKPYQTVSKLSLILRLGTMFENHEIIIPYKDSESKKQADNLLNECVSFAKENDKLIEIGVHPDLPIGLAYALQVSNKWSFRYLI